MWITNIWMLITVILLVIIIIILITLIRITIAYICTTQFWVLYTYQFIYYAELTFFIYGETYFLKFKLRISKNCEIRPSHKPEVKQGKGKVNGKTIYFCIKYTHRIYFGYLLWGRCLAKHQATYLGELVNKGVHRWETDPKFPKTILIFYQYEKWEI